ncbi:nodulation receptor kinase-like isoform X2 [Mercurialis annua]|uniref:nodulation receptor kinase-like isoform X2 n=1 Tax=Mercurialis annua TaxID=3986 RepID=UPI00215E0D16|nr:nodulation receptor kinase-like isoform X2 [Mercurialis annua]
MMAEQQNWIIKGLECFFCCLFILISSTLAKDGIVSIKCCAAPNSRDKSFINCISDYGLYPDNATCEKITRAEANFTGYDKVGVFYSNSGKRCYGLPTIKNQDYLIRANFLYGDLVGSALDVLIDISKVSTTKSSEDSQVEGIFKANGKYTDFCSQHSKADPHISELELRPLADSKYLQENASNVLKLIGRNDVGNVGVAIRYPVDKLDRIWKSPDPRLVSVSPDAVPVQANTTIDNASTTVPVEVLQSALTHTDRLEFLHKNIDAEEHNYTLFLYFLELDSNATGQRVFSIFINNEMKHENFHISVDGSNYNEVVLTVTATASLNLTLVKVTNESHFGPLLNAYEILQVKPWVQGTNQQDQDGIKQIRAELLHHNKENDVLQRWSGDPCLPLSWEGLTCELMNGSQVITRLDISSSSLHGPFPAITGLNYLTELNGSNNHFTGRIPSFQSSSTTLTSVDLRHNDLIGSLPISLTSLPHLTTLYFGCNPGLSNKVPSGFNSSGIATTDYGACLTQRQKNEIQGIVIGTIVVGSFLIALGLAFAFIYRRKFLTLGRFDWKQHQMTKNAIYSLPSSNDVAFKSINIQVFTLESIENATHKSRTLIGEGGFGPVYRGTLLDGQEVAVKVRSSTSTQGTREFENELNLLSTIRHENLVPLLGYCCEKDQQILVYPFMSNGSLQDRLYGEASKRKTLDWPTRLSIALGAARGLTHLHTFAGRCIIHRDVKSSNILLDQSMNAKVADFGFSKYAPQEGDSGASLEVRGTAGYMDPEYYSTHHLSAKSDVFSFGVVLLEIVSGREPLNIKRPRNEWSLVEWAKLYIRESKIDEIVDPSIKGGYHAEAMWRVVEAALACIEPFSAYRPSMVDIVRELEDALIIENNASEYMKSIDSIGGYSLGGSNRFSIITDKKNVLLPPTPTPTEPSPINTQALAPLEPR